LVKNKLEIIPLGTSLKGVKEKEERAKEEGSKNLEGVFLKRKFQIRP